ncbi:MAG TPA: hypothetical protein VJ810_38405 [Blastocatellia bacterium]|nr:hypothetical protein [Blastocatellia bacterium]
MSVQALMIGRREELRRRVESLHEEVSEWKSWANGQFNDELKSLEAHFSQLQAIDIIIAALINKQRALLEELEKENDNEVFRDKGFQLVQQIVKAQRFWDFFRDKLETRFSPRFKKPLWVADTVAWSCYRPVVELAAGEDILPLNGLREPPLTYLAAELTPVTFVRKSHAFEGRDRLRDVGDIERLPIPVIELPWDHIENLWMLLSIPHEVGHSFLSDFNLEKDLENSLQDALSSVGAATERIAEWQAWRNEVFADLAALQLAGPAFAEYLFDQLLLPANDVLTENPAGPHPTPYVRLLMNAAYIRTLAPGRQEMLTQADRITDQWKQFYGAPSKFIDYQKEFPHVFNALMNASLPSLKGKTVRELIPFTALHDAGIRAACDYLRTGQQMPAPNSILPRHCVSAARQAVTEAVSSMSGAAAQQMREQFEQVNQRTEQLVRNVAPSGVRAAVSAQRHQYLKTLAEEL